MSFGLEYHTVFNTGIRLTVFKRLDEESFDTPESYLFIPKIFPCLY